MRGLVFNAPRRERRETCDGLKLGGCCGALCAFLGAEARAHRQMVPVALAQLLLLADQPLLPANLSAVAKDFGFNDQQRDELLGGVVAVVFFTSGALSSLTAGYLADLVRRTTMISTCTLLGAAGSFSNAWVSTFAALLVCRACVGAAFGGLIPASYAIIGDLYPPEERPHAIAVLLLISGLGLSLGQALANCGWRFAFGLVGSLGLCLGLALLLLMQEPSHTRKDGAGGSLTALRLAMCKNTVLLLCLQAMLGCVPWAVIATFLTDYLSTDGRMGLAAATRVMLAFGVGCALGTSVGGKLGQRLYKKDKKLLAWLMAICACGGMIPLLLLFSCAGQIAPHWLMPLALVGGALEAITGNNAKAVLLNTVPAHCRGSVFGIYNIMDDLGKGLGPVVVASWEGFLGRKGAFLLGLSFWLPCSVICCLMARTFTKDSEDPCLELSLRQPAPASEEVS